MTDDGTNRRLAMVLRTLLSSTDAQIVQVGRGYELIVNGNIRIDSLHALPILDEFPGIIRTIPNEIENNKELFNEQ